MRNKRFTHIVLLLGVVLFLSQAVYAKKPEKPPKDTLKGIIKGAFPIYNGDSSIFIAPGYGECSGEYWEFNANQFVDLSSVIPTGEDFIYIYIEHVQSAYPSPPIYGSTVEPVYDGNKFGWYNGDDRCITVIPTPAGSATIKRFSVSDEVMIRYYVRRRILENAKSNRTWVRLRVGHLSPVNTMSLWMVVGGADWDSSSRMFVRAQEDDASQIWAYGYKNRGQLAGWLYLQRGWTRNLEWMTIEDDDPDGFIDLYGYKIER